MAEPTYIEGNELRKWVKQHLSRKLFQTAHELACQTKCEIIIKIQDGQNAQDSHYYATQTLETAFCNGGLRKEQWDINVSGDSFIKNDSNAVNTAPVSFNESSDFSTENFAGVQQDNSSDDNDMPSARRHPFGIIPRKQQQTQRVINQDANPVPIQNVISPTSQQSGIQISQKNPNCALVRVVPKQPKQLSQVRNINAQGTQILVGNSGNGTGSPTVVPIQEFNKLNKGGQVFIMQKVGNTQVLTPMAVQQVQGGTPAPTGMVSPTHQVQTDIKEPRKLCIRPDNPSDSQNTTATGGFSGRPFKCGVCYKTFGSVQVLSRHSQTFHEMVPNKRFFCDMCGKNYKHPQHLQQHMATHNSTAPYKCSQCHRGFYRMGTLKDHELLHLGMYRYYCPECRKGFMRPSLLQEHVNRFHTATVTPSAPAEDGDSLSGNMMESFPQQDGNDQVNLQNNEEGNMSANMSTDDNNPDNLNGITIKQERLSPTELDQETQPNQTSEMDTQVTQQDNSQTTSVSESLGQLPTMVPLSSPPQAKTTPTKVGSFTSVKQTRSPGPTNRRYSCDICGKTYKYVFHMREHRLTHSGQHPYVCKICNTGFFRQRQLREHQFRHSGSFPYTCEKCEKGFFRPSELRRHQSVKHGLVVNTPVSKNKILNP